MSATIILLKTINNMPLFGKTGNDFRAKNGLEFTLSKDKKSVEVKSPNHPGRLIHIPITSVLMFEVEETVSE